MENIIIGIRKTAHIPRASQKPFYKTIKKRLTLIPSTVLKS